jgi:hypothetical protein
MSSKHTETQNYFDMYNNLGDQKTYIEKVKSLLVSVCFVSVLVYAPCCVCEAKKRNIFIDIKTRNYKSAETGINS